MIKPSAELWNMLQPGLEEKASGGVRVKLRIIGVFIVTGGLRTSRL
jgi:hypothetical protein